MENLKMSLGSFIREKRLEQKLTLKEVADKMGFTTAYLSRFERDNIGPPCERAIRDLALAIKVDPDELTIKCQKVPEHIQNTFKENPQYLQFFRSAKALTQEGFEDTLRYMAEKQIPKSAQEND